MDISLPASMEPRLLSRGYDEIDKWNTTVWASASMEPRLLSRGYRRRGRRRGGSTWTLQWSHDFSAVDTRGQRDKRPQLARPASMEPRLLSRGYGEPRIIAKYDTEASMEPRLLSRGYALRFFCYGIAEIALQWSHDFSAVDTVQPVGPISDPYAASMEPRLLSRGYGLAAAAVVLLLPASMEPRLLSRGYNGGMRPSVRSHALQWSHDFSAVDTRTNH